jgi:hypothetical protein
MFDKNKKIAARIESLWQRPEDKYRNFELISKYHNIKKETAKGHTVDANTWQNLNFASLFEKMDYNLSCFGQQFMYHKLNSYETDKEILEKSFSNFGLFINDRKLRIETLKALFRLRGVNAYGLANLIFEKLPPKPRYYPLFYFLSAISLTSMLLMFFYGVFFFVFIAAGVINIIVNWQYSSRIYSYFTELAGLNSLLGAAVNLAAIKTGRPVEQFEVLKKHSKICRQIRKKIGWLIIDKTRLNDLIIAYVEYMNQFFLFELITFIRSIGKLNAHKEELIQVFEAAASIDYEIAAAAFLSNQKHFCLAEINKNNEFVLEEIFHPVLTSPVSNNFRIKDKSVLITGSNMAGKTTFIKTIGVNMILARTIGAALAKKASFPNCETLASINISDDITEGKSFYFAQIEEILRYINKIKSGGCYVFLIDEIFRGTNTAERISASKAVLDFLSSNSLLMVTTHDLELEEMLNGNFEMYNFSEQFENNRVFFNYKINKGKCTGRNAIKLLELTGYPSVIIKNAMEEYSKLSI